jgi:hypothetical protein
MLAVVGEESVAILAGTRACSLDDHCCSEPGGLFASHDDRAPAAEVPQRYLLHRSAGQKPGNCPTVHDPAVTHVDAVMEKAESRCDEMCAKRRLFRVGQSPLGSAMPSPCESLSI